MQIVLRLYIRVRRSGAAVLPHRARYKIQTGIRACFSRNDVCSQISENMLQFSTQKIIQSKPWD